MECGDDEQWVEPAWPADDTACAAGDDCAAPLSADPAFPADFLEVTSEPAAPIASGTVLSLACSDSAKVLALDWDGFSKECYNNGYLDWADQAGWPAEADCITPTPCPASQLAGLGTPDYMETAATDDPFDHGAKIEYTCRDGKSMVSAAADPDGDEKVATWCNAGIIDAPTWPSMSECLAVCTAVTLPPSAGFTDPGSFSILQGETLTLDCADPNYYVNDVWNSTSKVLTCLADGTLDAPETWPSCAERPLCPVPMIPGEGTGLEPVDPAATAAISESAVYRCIDNTRVKTINANNLRQPL